MMPTGIPHLKTDRLVLRPFSLSDAGRVMELADEKEIAAGTLNIPHPYTVQMATDWIEGHAGTFIRGEGVNFAITLKKSGLPIGAIGLILHAEHDRAEIGYWIGKEYWNVGYATEAASRLIKHAFVDLRLERVYAHHFSSNPASGRVLIKSGLRHEGTLRHHVKKQGRFQDLELYSILYDEWREGGAPD